MRNKLFRLLLAVVALLAMAGCSEDTAAKRKENVFADTAWIGESDQSYWTFSANKEFYWYQTKDNQEDNYYAGSYDVKLGREAIDYVTKDLKEYGVTEEEIDQLLKSNAETGGAEIFNEDGFICFTCTTTSFMLEGEEQLKQPMIIPYYGFYYEDAATGEAYFNVVNMQNGANFQFSREGK